MFVSVVLFIGSALLFKYKNACREKGRCPSSGKGDACEWYHQRRREERLSFHELDDEAPVMEVDFYPKNSNWDHFESYHGIHDLDTNGRRVSKEIDSFEVGLSDGQTPDDISLTSPLEIPKQKTLLRSQSLDADPVSAVDVRDQNRAARTSYNARIMPDQVILLRHGQSMGNIDERRYSTTADNAMPLTRLGWEQAKAAGKLLKQKLLLRKNVHFIVSPYVRAVETFHGIASAWCDPSEYDYIEDEDERLKAWYARLLEMGLTWHEDPRIREQDFGNFQDPTRIKKAKEDRNKFGAFYYRFPHGESASDVFDRISTFLDSLWRSFDVNQCRTYVIITHGISIRVLLARYFRYTVDQFHMLLNPRNCEIIKLEHDGAGRLQLTGRHELECNKITGKVTGYKFEEKLRVIPSQMVNNVKARTHYQPE